MTLRMIGLFVFFPPLWSILTSALEGTDAAYLPRVGAHAIAVNAVQDKSKNKGAIAYFRDL